MIGTITLNPSVDIHYSIKEFHAGGLFRANPPTKTPGGKGINVTRVIHILGERVAAAGFLGGDGGLFIEKSINELKVENRFTYIQGENRSCIAITDGSGGQTEILETGPVIQKKELMEFEEAFESLLTSCSIVCASGSLPKGISSDYYRLLAKKAGEAGVKFILDASGKALMDALPARPYMIKPNKDELSEIIGRPIETKNDVILALLSLRELKIDIILVSLGGDGAMLLYKDDVYEISVPQIKLVSAVGSGDSMTAGIACGLHRGMDVFEAVKLGAACGTANALSARTGDVDLVILEKIYKDIRLSKISDLKRSV